MSLALKRKLSAATRSISPPATRRKSSTPRGSQGEAQKLTAKESSACSPSRLSIFSWNVNGIAPLLQKPLSFDGSAEYPLRAFLRRHQWPAFLCLQEVKIASTDHATRRRVQTAANGRILLEAQEVKEPAYVVFFSLPRDKHNATGFGGKVHGVATLIRQDVASGGIEISKYKGEESETLSMITRAVPWDLEGRVLITLLTKHGDGLMLAIVNGYWVNGTSNLYRDPLTGEVSGTRHDHKLRFHQHMLDECRRLEVRGYHVVLIGDMNIAPARIDGHPTLRTTPVAHVHNRADFNSKFLSEQDEKGWGVDVFRALHGDARKYTYHPRRGQWGDSCDRVDLVVAGKSLTERGAVTGSDIEDTAAERRHSDHVPLWVSIDLDTLEAGPKRREHKNDEKKTAS